MDAQSVCWTNQEIDGRFGAKAVVIRPMTHVSKNDEATLFVSIDHQKSYNNGGWNQTNVRRGEAQDRPRHLPSHQVRLYGKGDWNRGHQSRSQCQYVRSWQCHENGSLTNQYICIYSVADINQSLVDDGLVDKEKISGSNYFWSFPAKNDRLAELRHQKAIEHIETLKKEKVQVEAALMDAKRGREEDDEDTGMTRAQKLARLEEIAKEKTIGEKELETLKENDPQALADLEKELQLVHQYVYQKCWTIPSHQNIFHKNRGANRWTDNIFICKDYLTKKRGMDSKQACKILEINAEFDCTSLSTEMLIVFFHSLDTVRSGR